MKVRAKYGVGKWLTGGVIYPVVRELDTQYVIIGNYSGEELAYKGHFDIVQEETPMTRIEDVMIEVPLHMLTAMTKTLGVQTPDVSRRALHEVIRSVVDVDYKETPTGYYTKAKELLNKAHKEYNSQFVVIDGKKYIKADYEAALASLKAY